MNMYKQVVSTSTVSDVLVLNVGGKYIVIVLLCLNQNEKYNTCLKSSSCRLFDRYCTTLRGTIV